MRVSAGVDYAVRAMVVLAARPPDTWTKGEIVAESQGLSFRYCEQLLAELRKAGLVVSQRGADGGYRLARPAADIVIADVVRAIDGPLGDVHGTAPEALDLPAPAAQVRELWVATRASLRAVLEHVSLADLVAGHLPAPVAELVDDPDAWRRRAVEHPR